MSIHTLQTADIDMDTQDTTDTNRCKTVLFFIVALNNIVLLCDMKFTLCFSVSCDRV